MIRLACSVPLAAASFLCAQAPIVHAPLPARAPVATAVAAPERPIDLALCLDISGSMDGLIDAARQNLWSVVNDLATLQPAPRLRVALLTYGCSAHDKEVGWVKTEIGFTTDLDAVSEKLFALTTNGGEEYVARVVKAATEQLDWSADPKALKLLFVAGNEAATQDPQHTTEIACRAAIAKGIVVNSIYCGNDQDQLAPAWRDVAKFADGQFAAIDHNKAVVIQTPFDEQLAALSTTINATYVPFGKAAGVWAANQVRQDGNASSLNVVAAAQRCQVKGSGLYDNRHWDLVDACRDPKFVLAEVKKEDLPEALRKLDLPALQAHVAEQQQKRDGIRKQIEALGKQREEFVQQKQREMEQSGLFENAVLEAVRQQAEARGFVRKQAAPAKPGAAGTGLDERFVPVIEAAAKEYDRFPRVTGEFHVAPTDCKMAPPRARISAAEKAHGGKLYLLFARLAKEGRYVEAGVPAAVGETLVKEAWVANEGPVQGRTEASVRYPLLPVVREDGKVFHAGDRHGLFVMHKLAADTPGTDGGWIYGTVDAAGKVTSAGLVASCIRCHQDAPEDRRFGLR